MILTTRDLRPAGTSRVWRIGAEESERVIFEHNGGVTHASFSPNGRCVLMAGDDGTAQIWDAIKGEPLTPLSKRREPRPPKNQPSINTNGVEP